MTLTTIQRLPLLQLQVVTIMLHDVQLDIAWVAEIYGVILSLKQHLNDKVVHLCLLCIYLFIW